MDRTHPMHVPTVLFHEVQHMIRNPVLLALLPGSLVPTSVLLLGLAYRTGDTDLVWAWAGVTVFEVGLMALLRMETTVTDRELRVVFRPVYRRRVPVGTIDSVGAVKYNPMEAGGWGVKASRRYGRVVNVRGDRGVAVAAGERRMLIGTQRPEELEAALRAAAGRG